MNISSYILLIISLAINALDVDDGGEDCVYLRPMTSDEYIALDEDKNMYFATPCHITRRDADCEAREIRSPAVMFDPSGEYCLSKYAYCPK